MKAICGLNCDSCTFSENCGGCAETKGRPFGGSCIIADCCAGHGCGSCGKAFAAPCRLKEELIAEFNGLKINDMEEVTELNALSGSYINLNYTLPGGQIIQFWDDRKVYLGNQLRKKDTDRCYGLAADEKYLLVCEYGEGGNDAEIVVFKKRKSPLELWDAYDSAGSLTGKTLIRGDAIPKGLYHGVAEVFVLHDDGSVLLMQRDWNKPNYPGFWESGASGSVVKGESFLQGALRELWEETGIRAESLESVYTVFGRNAIYKGYLCRTKAPKDTVTLQPGETIAFRWVDKETFLEIFRSAKFVDSLRERLQIFVEREIVPGIDA